MKSLKADAHKPQSTAAAAQRLQRLVPNEECRFPDVREHSLLDSTLLLSACRDSILRGPAELPQRRMLRCDTATCVPRFVCCNLNCESSEQRLYRSPISGAVQGVLSGHGSVDEAQKDEAFVAEWMQSAATSSNASIANVHKQLEERPTVWGSRVQCLRRLEQRLNRILQEYCTKYCDGEPRVTSCGASAFVSQSRRHSTKDQQTESEQASVQVDIIILFGNDATSVDTRRSLFDDGWEAPARPTRPPSRKWKNWFASHHAFELQFFSAKNTMILHHCHDMHLSRGVPHSCAPNMTATHHWSLKDHRRPENHQYQDQHMLSAAQSRDSLDPINTMHVDKVAECVLSAVQQAENAAIQDALDSKVPFVTQRSLFIACQANGMPSTEPSEQR